MGAMGGRGGLRQVWADLLDCCTPMQAGDLTDFEPLPNRQNAFSYEKERPAQGEGQLQQMPNQDLRLAAWGEKMPDMLRAPAGSHRAPEVQQASFDMHSHVTPQQLNRSTPSSNGRSSSPVRQNLYPQGSSWANPQHSEAAGNPGGAVHSHGAAAWDSAAGWDVKGAPVGGVGGPREVAFFLTRDERPNAAPAPNQGLRFVPYSVRPVIARDGGASPNPSVEPDLPKVLMRKRIKEVQRDADGRETTAFVQILADGSTLPLPDEYTFALGTQHAHRMLRTRLAWPVPLSEEEVPVLFKGVEAYVQENQTLPSSLSDLLPYCD